MALRLSLVIDGDAQGAKRAAEETRRAVTELSRETGTAQATTKRAADETSQSILLMSRNATTAVAALRSLALGFGLGALIGAGGLTGAIGQSVRAFAEFERQQLTTQQVIRATGGAAGRTAEDIERLSRAIGMATLASTREVREAANQLLTFRSIAGDTFDRTLKLAQDLAAVGFGSVSSAAVQLGRALEDPEQGLQALRRVGVSFTAAQRELIRNFLETGRVADAQREVLKAVEAQVGGAGGAAAGGLAGAWDSLTEATAVWLEQTGATIAKALGLRDAILGIANAIDQFNQRAGRSPAELGDVRFRLLEAERRSILAERGATGMPEFGAERLQEIEREQAAIADLAAETVRLANARQAAAQQASRQAQEGIARSRVDAEIGRLREEAEALKRSELANAQLQAVRRAGVAIDSEAGREIAALVARNFQLAEAQKHAAQTASERQSAWDAGRRSVADLIGALQLELDVMRETDPVLREMVQLRDTLAFATAAEAAAVRDLIAAREREREEIRRLDQMRSLARGFFADLRTGLRDGASLAEAFANAIGRLSDRLLELASNKLLDALLGAPGSPNAGSVGTFLNSIFAGVFHGGGVVGATPVPARAVPAGVFMGAPRLHAGLRPNEFPAILEEGEKVIPRGQAAAGPVMNFYVTTPNPRAFAEDRATLMRGANRLFAQAQRFA